MNDIWKVNSAESAAAFQHPRSRRIILDLVSKEQSLRELSIGTRLSLSLLHYHVGRLRSLGLVEVTREERRAGRSVKRYRAVARRFLVPAALADEGGGEALARELRARLQRDRARNDDAGRVYYVDDDGAHRMRRIGGRSTTCAFEAWIVLSLTPETAEELRGDLRTLFARYSHQSDRGTPVIAYCAFAERA